MLFAEQKLHATVLAYNLKSLSLLSCPHNIHYTTDGRCMLLTNYKSVLEKLYSAQDRNAETCVIEKK